MPGSNSADDQAKLLAELEASLSRQLELIAGKDIEAVQRLNATVSGLLKRLDASMLGSADAGQLSRVKSLFRVVSTALACETDRVRKELSRTTDFRSKIAAYRNA